MMISTYFNDSELNQPITNKTVNEWLEEARKCSRTKWFVIEKPFVLRKWKRFKRVNITTYLYQLVVEVNYPSGATDHQIINFYRDGTDWSINTYVPAELVVAYLIGVCSEGIKRERNKNE